VCDMNNVVVKRKGVTLVRYEVEYISMEYALAFSCKSRLRAELFRYPVLAVDGFCVLCIHRDYSTLR